MKKEIKERWIQALRSGEYEQGWEQLSYPVYQEARRYCALGVLVDLHLKENNQKWTLELDVFGMVPEEVKKWAEIDDDTQNSIIAFNDGGYDFKQIARILEDEDGV